MRGMRVLPRRGSRKSWMTDCIFFLSNNPNFCSRIRSCGPTNPSNRVFRVVLNPCIHQEVPNYHYLEEADDDVVVADIHLDCSTALGADPADTVPARRYRTEIRRIVEEEGHRSSADHSLDSDSGHIHLDTAGVEGLDMSYTAAEEGRCRSCIPVEGVGSAAEEPHVADPDPDLHTDRLGPCLAKRLAPLIQILVARADGQLSRRELP